MIVDVLERATSGCYILHVLNTDTQREAFGIELPAVCERLDWTDVSFISAHLHHYKQAVDDDDDTTEEGSGERLFL